MAGRHPLFTFHRNGSDFGHLLLLSWLLLLRQSVSQLRYFLNFESCINNSVFVSFQFRKSSRFGRANIHPVLIRENKSLSQTTSPGTL